MGDSKPTMLALRAYGDFTILLAHANAAAGSTAVAGTANASFANPAKIIASSHLQPLYNALKNAGAVKQIDIQFEDFLIRGSLLRAFTNKQFFGTATVQQLQKLVQYIHALPPATVYLEQSARAWLLQIFTKKKLVPISQGKQVYQEYANFFRTELPPIVCPSFIQKILVLPTSRQAKKNMPNSSIVAIQRKHPTAIVQVALFGNSETIMEEIRKSLASLKDSNLKLSNLQLSQYTSFDELIQLIQSHDFVYCPDSAQAHICQFLGKAHFMLYPNQYHLAFATPFVLQQQQYAAFQEFEKQ
jgi:hypothetical protein